VVKNAVDRYSELKKRMEDTNSRRRVYKLEQMAAALDEEMAEEKSEHINLLLAASSHRLTMLELQLEEAQLDDNADRIVEATALFETAQQEHEELNDQYDEARLERERAVKRQVAARTKYENIMQSVAGVTEEEYRSKWDDYHALSKIVREKRVDNELADELKPLGI